jgi:tetratricopeptide (TPR) repeat protein
MKRILLSVTILSALACLPAFAQRGRLANAGKAGLNVTSLDQVLRLEDDQIDLATAVLISSEYWSGAVPGRRYLERLDAMAGEIQSRLRQQGLPADYRAIPVINQYLFQELGFRPISHANDPNDLFLHSVMDRRQGYCLSLSVLYLSLGERLGLALYGVVVPGHFFVRYDSGDARFNIETTSDGARATDKEYATQFHVPENHRDSIYLKNLNKRQTLGCFFNNLGNVYHEIGDLDGALAALERAVGINPMLSESRTNLGNIYMQKGRVNEAVLQYRGALELNPRDAKTYCGLGNAQMTLNQPSPATSSYQQAIQLDPNFVDAYRNLAALYTRQRKYQQALPLLNQAIALDSRNHQSYLLLGEVYFRMEDCERGLTQYRKALSLKPDSPDAYYGLGICYGKLGRSAEEIQAYTQALVLKPDMFAALTDLGAIYYQQENYSLAAHYFHQAAAVRPDDPGILFNLGSAYLRQNRFDQAVQTYQRVLKLDPKAGEAHYWLAVGYYSLQKYDLAWNHVNAARRLGVKVPEDLFQAVRSRVTIK